MRKVLPQKLEAGRLRNFGQWSSEPDYGANGAFHIRGPRGRELRIVGSDGEDEDAQGWEHVSVSTDNRPPNWDEMCFVKALFWDDEEVVVQFHPAKSQYVNHHPYCLHLWRHKQHVFPVPPSNLVGPK